MANYYVSPTGNDISGDGSTGNPWEHIYYAVSQITGSDIIKCKDGTFNDEQVMNLTQDVTIESESGSYADVIIETTNGSSNGILFQMSSGGRTLSLNNVTVVHKGGGGTYVSVIRSNDSSADFISVGCFFKVDGSSTYPIVFHEFNQQCLFYKNTVRGYWATCWTNNSEASSQFVDNAFEGNTYGVGFGYLSTDSNGFYNNTNDVYGGGLGTNPITADPKYSGADVAEVEPTSPYIDAGVTISGYVTSYIEDAPDIGCAETTTIYYVSPTGNDSTGDGTYGNPWEHIHNAIDQLDADGYTIKCLDGTYDEEIGRAIPYDITIESYSENYADVILKPLTLGNTNGFGTFYVLSTVSKTLTLLNLTVHFYKSFYTGDDPQGDHFIHINVNSTVEFVKCFVNSEDAYSGTSNVRAVRGYFSDWSVTAYKSTFKNFRDSTDSYGQVFRDVVVTSKDCLYENNNEVLNSGTYIGNDNCFYDYNTLGLTPDVSDLTSDPKSDGVNVATLASDSPCIDAGVTIPGYVETYEGTAPDIGCAEYSAPMAVTTNSATNVDHDSATLNGNLDSLGIESSVYVWFEYWEDVSGASHFETSQDTETSTGAFTAELTSLSEGTTYRFKAMVSAIASGSTPEEGNELTFKTALEQQLADTVTLTDSIVITPGKFLNDTVTLSDEILVQPSKENVYLEDAITLSDSISFGAIELELEDTITLSDSVLAWAKMSYANRVRRNGTDLYVVSEESPAKIAKIDISGGTPSIEIYEFDQIGETCNNATDLAINNTFDNIYVSCEAGQVMKLDLNDLSSRTQLDTGDTDNLLNIDTLDDFNYAYASTSDADGEIILIDQTNITKINSKFSFLETVLKTMNSFVNLVKAKFLNSDFRFLAVISTKLKSDFRFTQESYSTLTPLSREDFHVYIDSVESTDVDLETIRVIKSEGDRQEAYFTLGRRHDKINYTLDNTYSQITNQNNIKVYVQSTLVFEGLIDNLYCSSDETIDVTAKGEIGERKFNSIELSLASLTNQRHLYDVIVDNININNPVVDVDDENPSIYKGIKIDLGTEITENISKWVNLGSATIPNQTINFPSSPTEQSSLADQIKDGTFNPKQNWTYFWWASATKPLEPYTGFQNVQSAGKSFYNRYIGTGISGLSTDLWDIVGLSYRFQRVFDNTEVELGFYYLGSAPYKEVSARNGKFITKLKWEDKNDGFHITRAEGYDYVEYAQTVAEIEYEKIKNINGNVVPTTDASINLTVDAFLYYQIYLNTRVSIVNTIESDIYKDNNGFPVSVKAFELNSGTMTASLTCDNLKSQYELDALDDTYPDEDSEDYIIPESDFLKTTKFDIPSFKQVQ